MSLSKAHLQREDEPCLAPQLKGKASGRRAEAQGMERLHPVAFGWSSTEQCLFQSVLQTKAITTNVISLDRDPTRCHCHGHV